VKSSSSNFATTWASASTLLPMSTGNTYMPALNISSGQSLTTNTLYVVPIYVSGTFTATSLKVTTSTVTTSGTGRVGIYNSGTGGAPSTLLLDGGSVSYSASTTQYSVTISQSLTQGWYWLGFVVQTGSATWYSYLNGANGSAFPTQLAHSSVGNNFINNYTTTGVTGALPSSPTWTANNTYPPIVKVSF